MPILYQQRRPDLPALTGLRAVAAAAVVLTHLRGHVRALLPGAEPLDGLLSTGALGVELFFVLSGFVIAYHYAETLARPSWATYRRFLRQRLARIYPVHVFTIGVLALFVLTMGAAGRTVAQASGYGLRDLVANLTLTHCWTLRDCGVSWNAPSWSLSAEWLAYLAFPLVALLVGAARRPRALLALGVAVVVTQLWMTEVAGLGGGAARIAASFTLGALLARVHVHGLPRLARLPWASVAAWAAGSAVVLAWALVELGRPPTAVVPLFGLVVLGLANAGEGRLARALGTPVARFWGQASYSLYMTHAVVLAVAAEFVRLELAAAAPLSVRVALLGGYVVGMFAVAAWTHTLVEEPWRRRFAAAPVAALAVPAGSVAPARHAARARPAADTRADPVPLLRG